VLISTSKKAIILILEGADVDYVEVSENDLNHAV
jgi:hypothetical protein